MCCCNAIQQFNCRSLRLASKLLTNKHTSWYLTDPNTIPNDLQYTDVPLIGKAKCNTIWTNMIDDSMQCAGADGSTSCMVCTYIKHFYVFVLTWFRRFLSQGDSGGPLVQQVNGVWTLVGAVSWGSSRCSTSSPGVYARIAYGRDWINQVTGL